MSSFTPEELLERGCELLAEVVFGEGEGGDLLVPVISLAQAFHKRRDELAARLVVELGVAEHQGGDLALVVL